MKTQTQESRVTRREHSVLSRLRQRFSWLLYLMFFAAATVVNAAPKKVLFYEPLHNANGVAAQLVNANPQPGQEDEFANIGQGSDVWRPGHSNPGKDWNLKTTADFAAFDLIVIGDPGFGSVNNQLLAGAIANRSLWSAAVSGNVLIISGDPELHAALATEFIQQAIRFAANGPSSGPGLYLASGFLSPHSSPIDPFQEALPHLLDAFGTFDWVQPSGQEVTKLATGPQLNCVSDADMSNWGTSAHGGFHDWPAPFIPFAMVTDVPESLFTPANKLPPDYRGLVHVLVRSDPADDQPRRYYVTPLDAGRILNQQHTVTATYLNSAGNGVSGLNVTFEVITGPNQGKSAVLATGPDGKANWIYTGDGGTGRDEITVTFNTPECAQTVFATCDWSDQLVTIVATDATAGEPGATGGNGVFTVTRTGNTAGGLTVPLDFDGTATFGTDYDVTPSTVVSFNPGQLTQNVTVTPLADVLAEPVETVIASIIPDPSGGYAVGTPSEATVTINSLQTANIWVTIVDGNIDESGFNSGTLRLNRSSSAGSTTVHVGFSGAAYFNVDYVIDGLNPNGTPTITIPNGVSFVDFLVVAIPDTRDEGAGESVTVTVLRSPDGTYVVVSPAAQTVTITDDDVVNLPGNGWKLTDLGTTAPTYGRGINTLVGGAQAVGDAYFGDTYGYINLGFRYYNGARTWLYPQYSLPYYGWVESGVSAINNNGVSVGYQKFYDPYNSPNYGQQACLWKNNASATPVPLPHIGPFNALVNTAVDISQRDDLEQTGGIVVGNNMVWPSAKIHVVAWIPDANGNYPSATDLGDIGDGFTLQNSYAGAINVWGEVVGKSQHSVGTSYHAFRSREDGFGSPVALLPQDDQGTATFVDAHTSEGFDINSFTELVGASQSPAGQYRAMYKAPFTGKHQGWSDLGVLGTGASAGNWSAAYAINDQGLIVGQSTIKIGSSYQTRAFVVGNAGNPGSQAMLELTGQAWVFLSGQWYTAASTGWTLMSAERINGNNWIAGWGYKSGQYRAFMLSPR